MLYVSYNQKTNEVIETELFTRSMGLWELGSNEGGQRCRLPIIR